MRKFKSVAVLRHPPYVARAARPTSRVGRPTRQWNRALTPGRAARALVRHFSLQSELARLPRAMQPSHTIT